MKTISTRVYRKKGIKRKYKKVPRRPRRPRRPRGLDNDWFLFLLAIWDILDLWAFSA